MGNESRTESREERQERLNKMRELGSAPEQPAQDKIDRRPVSEKFHRDKSKWTRNGWPPR